MSQLERDLRKRINERLGRWAQDSIALYEMADLHDEATPAMVTTLLNFAAFVLTQLDSDPEKAGEILAAAMRECQKSAARHRER